MNALWTASRASSSLRRRRRAAARRRPLVERTSCSNADSSPARSRATSCGSSRARVLDIGCAVYPELGRGKAHCAGGAVMTRPLTRRFAAPSPRFAGRGISRELLLPACGEKVAEGRMRGMTQQPLEQYLAARRAQIDRTLDATLPPAHTPPTVIHQAMRYAVLGGGKRVRPILAIAAAEACGAVIEPLLVPFAALELIHTYSLVHDDLPALDNDDLRRGRKTTHVVYGEAMAILTGDALLTEAFVWLARAGQAKAIEVVAEAINSQGMIGGQVADLEGGLEPASTLADLEF